MEAKDLNRSKHHKKKKIDKSSAGNGNPEVFVLPPDLLQKLGINLGSMNTLMPAKPKDTTGAGNNISSPEKDCNLGEESILTTATLMKKSVSLMLSPTFVPTNTNMIPGEMEIACMVAEPQKVIPKFCSKTDIPDANVTFIPVTSVVANSNCKKPNNEFSNINRGKKSSSHIDTENISIRNNEVTIPKDNINVFNQSTKYPAAKTSDPLEKQSDKSFVASLKSTDQVESQKKSSKINIISEERIGPSKLKKIKTLCPKISDLTLVTKNTVISKKKSKDDDCPNDLNLGDHNIKLNLEVGNQNMGINSTINENLYTEAIIVKDSNIALVNNKVETSNHSVKDNEDDVINNIPIQLASENLKNQQTLQICNYDLIDIPIGIFNKNTQETITTAECLDETQNNGEINNCDLDTLIPVITDCNISDGISDVILDVFGMSHNDCSNNDSRTYDGENRVVNLCKEVNANEYCAENTSSLTDLMQKEECLQLKENTVYTSMKNNNEHEFIAKIKKYNDTKIMNEINNIVNIQEEVPISIGDITSELKNIDDSLSSTRYTREYNFTSGKKHDKEPMDGNHNAIQTKLCIQGVEKPGGNNEYQDMGNKYKALKTYQRPRKPKSSHLPVNYTSKNESCETFCTPDEEINVISITANVNLKEFCVCDDFGRLNYYESDHEYEHIHFWQHVDINTDEKLIFSIYHDGNITDKIEACNEYIADRDNKEPEYTICWNYFQCRKDDNPDQIYKSPVLAANANDEKNITKFADGVQLDNTINSDSIDLLSRGNEITNDTISILTTVNAEQPPISSEKKIYIKESRQNNMESSSLRIGNTYINEDGAELELNNKNKEVQIRREEQSKSAYTDKEEKTMSMIKQSRTCKNRNDESSHKESSPNHTQELIKSSGVNSSNETEPSMLNKSTEKKTVICDRDISKNIPHKQKETSLKLKKKCGTEENKMPTDALETKIKINSTKINNEEYHKDPKPNKRLNTDQCYSNDGTILKKQLDITQQEQPRSLKSVNAIETSKLTSKKMIKQYKPKNRIGGLNKETVNTTIDSEAKMEPQSLDPRQTSEIGKLKTRANEKNCQETILCSEKEEITEKSSQSIQISDIVKTKPSDTKETNVLDNIDHAPKNIVQPVNNSAKNNASTSQVNRSKKSYKSKVSMDKGSDKEDNKNSKGKKSQSHRASEMVDNEDGINKAKKILDKNGPEHLLQSEKSKLQATKPNEDIEATTSKALKKNSKRSKRKSSVLDSSISSVDSDEPDRKKQTKCGVCNELVSEVNWESHIIIQHHFIAWKVGETIDLDDENLRKKLYQILKLSGLLKCAFCHQEIRCLRKFLIHVKKCLDRVLSNTQSLICGVCKIDVQASDWHEHIGKQHGYLAWIEGENPINLQDSNAVRQHLLQVVNLYGDLVCYKCGAARKRPYAYFTHIETCTGNGEWLNDSAFDSELNRTTQSEVSENTDGSPASKLHHVTCAVCSQDLVPSQWIDHIAKDHNYLAWRVGSKPLDFKNQDDVKNHLMKIAKRHDGLKCSKCGIVRKRAKLYLDHVKSCTGVETQVDDCGFGFDLNISETNNESMQPPETVDVCAVCKRTMSSTQWISHISTEHNYMAWKEGSTPLDPNNEIEVRIYLTTIGKENGGLSCHRCGDSFKYAKSYLDHIKEICGASLNDSNLDASYASTSNQDTTDVINLSQITMDTVKCGVCADEVKKADWLEHIGKAHFYRAWVDGKEPPDFEDKDFLQKYLISVANAAKGLKCYTCGLVRKYPRAYLQHVETCDTFPVEDTNESITEEVECGVCHKKVDAAKWTSHAMGEHYNIAWIEGDTPIDLNSPYVVEVYIKKYQKRYKNLICKVCGASRVSRVGFYAHILICGKTEEEKEMFQRDCEICKKKYLIIYTSQHMTAHRETIMARERKQLVKEEKERKNKALEEERVTDLSNTRRKAAEKAKDVIKKYRDGMKEGAHQCTKCGFGTEVESELVDHECEEDASDSDESVKMDQFSDDESVDTEIDSNISDEETQVLSKRLSDCSIANRVQRFPFVIKAPRAYSKESGKQYILMHLSTEDLFLEWRDCEYEAVAEEDVAKYLPTLEESCQLKLNASDEWSTYRRFEARKHKLSTLTNFVVFAGASVQSVSWVPVRSDCDPAESNLLAVVTHMGADLPRYEWDEMAEGPGLIQIWNCGNFTLPPELVLGIAHDYGTVWGLSWCSSGARDVPLYGAGQTARLGLFAAACSNGLAYIFSVPYPSTIAENDKRFYKLKPVAELRISMCGNRKKYQATTVKWSPQKHHSHILVGYSDGSIAYFDINTESPLLRSTENNTTIFYPYHDEKYLKNCVEDVDVFPTLEDHVGPVAGAGVAGSTAVRGAGAGGAMFSQMPVAQALFQPHWPSVMMCGDEAMSGSTALNEMEWWGGGRRFGGARVACSCVRCGRVVTATLPLLRLLRSPPLYPETHKLIIGVIQMMPVNNKIKRKQNDDLSMVVEPTTYEDAVKKYGIQYEFISGKEKSVQRRLSARPRPPCPERFPLADVTSLAFCPALSHHDRLAVAVHGGFVFVTSV